MTIEIGVIFTLIASIIGVAGFLGGQKSAAKKDGVEWGELKSDVKYIKDKISTLENSYETNIKYFDEKIGRVYERMDEKINEHLKYFHIEKIIT